MAGWTIDLDVSASTSLTFDEPGNAVWFGGADGGIYSWRLLDRRLTKHGDGWEDLLAVVPVPDGLSAAVVLADGDIFLRPRVGAGRTPAMAPAIPVGRPLRAVAALADGDLVVLTTDGSLRRVTPLAGTVEVVADGFPDAVGVTVDEAAGHVVLAQTGATPSVHRIDLLTGADVGPVMPLGGLAGPVVAITGHPGGAGVLVADASGLVSAVLWSGADPWTTTLAMPATSLCRWFSLVVARVGDGDAASTFELFEWGDDETRLPVSAGFEPVAVGGWSSFRPDYPAAGLTEADVQWEVLEGPHAGSISVARPPGAAPDEHEHRLLSGMVPGEITVAGSLRADGSTLATRRFRVVSRWPDEESGPPRAVTGRQQVYAKGGWGGGPAGPQNIRLTPAPEELRVVVALFRTKGRTSGVDGSAQVPLFADHVVGPGQSVRTFYEEVSRRTTAAPAAPGDPKGTTVTLMGGRVFGPIDVNYAWGDLFSPDDRTQPWAPWSPKGDTWDVLGGALSSHLVDLGIDGQVSWPSDSLVFAVLPGTDDPYMTGVDSWSAQWSWAMAADAAVFTKAERSTTFGRRPAVIMPAAFPANHPEPWSAKEWVSTICHELGHTLGCPDLYDGGGYPAELGGRYVGGWDLMAHDAPLPFMSLPHRMRLGWVNPAWVDVFDFAANPAGRTVTLQATETLTRQGPPAGRKAGVEVRVRDGWNYYFEYRRKQAGQVADQELPHAQTVLGSDVHSAAATEMNRPLILKLPLDVDGDGPLLRAAGQDYEESDVTNPDRMNDFRITRRPNGFIGGDPDSVTLDVEYVRAHRAQLQVQPAPGRGIFKSPDIDVDGPGGPGVVVKGKTNTVTVHVHNLGTKAADAVKLKVRWLPFTTAAGAWVELASPAPQAMPAKSDRDFVVSWAVPASVKVGDDEVEHFCVRVDVDRYVDPTGPDGSEIVINDNWAQSNFATAAVGHASPSERRRSPVTAHNKLARRAMHRTLLEQSGEHFRAYLDHSWRWLEPGHDDVTIVDFESLAGDPVHGETFQRAFEETRGERMVTDLVARTFVHPGSPIDGPLERFGAQLAVKAGLLTFMRDVRAAGEVVSGTVLAGDPDGAQPVGAGDLRAVAWFEEDPEVQYWRDDVVRPDGDFFILFPDEIFQGLGDRRALVAVFYLGSSLFAPCHSEDVRIEV